MGEVVIGFLIGPGVSVWCPVYAPGQNCPVPDFSLDKTAIIIDHSHRRGSSDNASRVGSFWLGLP
jgi:hypothetical protein